MPHYNEMVPVDTDTYVLVMVHGVERDERGVGFVPDYTVVGMMFRGVEVAIPQIPCATEIDKIFGKDITEWVMEEWQEKLAVKRGDA